MKIVNIVTNINNGAGLQRDAELFAALLEKLGHRPRLIAYDRPHTGIAYPADISLFMEIMLPDFLHHAKENWLMPNSEWWEAKYDPILPFISKVLCKTYDCYRIWEQKLPGKCVYTGFESTDFFDNVSAENKENNFLHLAGNSSAKNSDSVIDAWRRFNIPYHLEMVIKDISFIPRCVGVRNVTYRARMPEAQVRQAMNVRQFHIMPSHYEGYGHALHEALGCGGIVLTTNAPPMNEFAGVPKEFLIPSQTIWQKCLATCHRVSPEAVYEAVMKAGEISKSRRNELSVAARTAFLKDREDFRKIIAEIFA